MNVRLCEHPEARLAILSLYQLPMANRSVLGVDALAVRGPALEDALEFVRVLLFEASWRQF